MKLFESKWKKFVSESSKSIRDFEKIYSIVPLAIKEIQAEYDSWQQDEDGFSDYIDPTSSSEIGSGGLCHVFAAIVGRHLSNVGVEVYEVSSCHEQHVYLVFVVREGQNIGVYELDIPYSIYESGGGFTWRKREGVQFSEEDFSIYKLSSDPKDLKEYVDDIDFEDEEESDEDR